MKHREQVEEALNWLLEGGYDHKYNRHISYEEEVKDVLDFVFAHNDPIIREAYSDLEDLIMTDDPDLSGSNVTDYDLGFSCRAIGGAFLRLVTLIEGKSDLAYPISRIGTIRDNFPSELLDRFHTRLVDEFMEEVEEELAVVWSKITGRKCSSEDLVQIFNYFINDLKKASHKELRRLVNTGSVEERYLCYKIDQKIQEEVSK